MEAKATRSTEKGLLECPPQQWPHFLCPLDVSHLWLSWSREASDEISLMSASSVSFFLYAPRFEPFQKLLSDDLASVVGRIITASAPSSSTQSPPASISSSDDSPPSLAAILNGPSILQHLTDLEQPHRCSLERCC